MHITRIFVSTWRSVVLIEVFIVTFSVQSFIKLPGDGPIINHAIFLPNPAKLKFHTDRGIRRYATYASLKSLFK